MREPGSGNRFYPRRGRTVALGVSSNVGTSQIQKRAQRDAAVWPLDHKSEVFDFIGRDALLAHVTLKFQVNLKNKQRLGAVFVTDKGSKDEKVLGLITAWDVAGTELK